MLNPALKVKIDDKRRRKPKHVGTKREAFKKYAWKSNAVLLLTLLTERMTKHFCLG